MADRTSSKSLPKGVRVRSGSIQIYFERKGKAYNITLPHPATAEGIATAAKIRNQLIVKAEWGILTDRDIIEARGDVVEDEHQVIINKNDVLFQDLAQKFLDRCDANSDTKRGYLRILNHHWMPTLALTPIHKITNDDIWDLINERDFQTAKTLNNSLIPLRGVFEMALSSKAILDNPMAGIENKKVQMGIPDPFSREEMNALLDWMSKNLVDDERFYYWYFEFAFWTGCRPSEMFALNDTTDVDWFNNTFRVNKSRVRGREKNVTKTHNARDVYLNDRSKKAIEGLVSFKKNEGYRGNHLMICPKTYEPFTNERAPRIRFQRALKACSIRPRPAYNTRHTYATMLLMDGVNPVFVADQLGHSLQMLMKRYAKWMHGDKNKIEIAKLNTQ